MQKIYLVLLSSSMCLAAPQVGFGNASPDEIAEIRAGTYLETFDENPQYNFNYKVADDTEQTYMAMNENRDGDQVTGSYQYVDPYGSLIVVTYSAGAMGYTETREVQEGFVQINPRPVKQFSSASLGSNSNSGSFNSGSSFSSGGSSFSSSGGSSLSGGSSSSLGSSSGLSSSSSSSFNADDIIAAIVSQVQPLISQTVSTAVSGAGRRPLAPPAPAPAPAVALNTNSIVAQIVSEIGPLVSQTVSSAVSGNNRNSLRPVPAPRAPAPVAAAPRPAPATASRNLGSVTDLFGSGGDFNVRFNTPSFNIEY